MGEYASAGIPFYWLAWIADNHVASIDIHVLDHTVGAYRHFRTRARSLGLAVQVTADYRHDRDHLALAPLRMTT
jgi:hypothetical protein